MKSQKVNVGMNKVSMHIQNRFDWQVHTEDSNKQGAELEGMPTVRAEEKTRLRKESLLLYTWQSWPWASWNDVDNEKPPDTTVKWWI